MRNPLLAAYLAFAGEVGMRLMLYRGRQRAEPHPGTLGLPYEHVELVAADGLRLSAWYVPAARPSGRGIVHVNGHAGDKGWWVRNRICAWLHDDYDQIMPDLRACGDSEGRLISFGWFEHLDVAAASAELRRRGCRQVAVNGNSMGAATALKAAADDPELCAVWADSPYATVYSAILSAAIMHHAPFPKQAARAIVERARREIGEDFTATEPLAVVGAIGQRPLMVVHGAKDPYIDPENSKMVYLAAPTVDKELWLVPEGRHGNSASYAPAEYRDRMLDFFSRSFAKARQECL